MNVFILTVLIHYQSVFSRNAYAIYDTQQFVSMAQCENAKEIAMEKTKSLKAKADIYDVSCRTVAAL